MASTIPTTQATIPAWGQHGTDKRAAYAIASSLVELSFAIDSLAERMGSMGFDVAHEQQAIADAQAGAAEAAAWFYHTLD